MNTDTHSLITPWLSDCFVQNSSSRAITFIRDGEIETVLTYGELAGEIDRFAALFLGYSLKSGDRVVLFLEKSLAAAVCHLALLKLGIIPVPLNPGFKGEELDYLLGDCTPGLLIVQKEKKEFTRRVSQGIPVLEIDTLSPYQDLKLTGKTGFPPQKNSTFRPDTSDPALMIYTSGTTGNPKGAVLTQGNLASDAAKIIKAWEITSRDVLCHALPLFHIHGLCFALHTCLLAGAHVVMTDNFKAEQVLPILAGQTESIFCTVFMAVPTMYSKLFEVMGDKKSASFDFSHLRLVTSGSAPLAPRDFKRIKEYFGLEPVEREGMSETGMNFSNPLFGVKKAGSIGLLLPGVEVKIDPVGSGSAARTGEVGQLLLKGPSIIREYWQKPGVTKNSFKNGWFLTGDLGYVDSEGYYFLTDRLKHIIITGGENVSAKEVERVIEQLPQVAEACVIGLPDEKWGEKIAAAVVLKKNCRINEQEIKDFCKEKLVNLKCPKHIVFTGSLPRNAMGKMLKEQVKKLF